MSSPYIWAPTLTPGETRVEFGGSSFSSTPTVAEINASAHINQIIAVLNRREILRGAYSPGSGPEAYLTTGRLSAAKLNSIRSHINTHRGAVGESSYSFGASIVAREKIKAAHLDDLRAALDFDFGVTLPCTIGRQRFQADNPYNTPTGYVNDIPQSGAFAGYFQIGKNPDGASDLNRARGGASFLLPAGLESDVAGILHVAGNTYTNSLEIWFPKVYVSNHDDHATPVGWHTHLDTVLTTFWAYAATGDRALPVPDTLVAAAASLNRYLSFVIGSSQELANAGAGRSGSSSADCNVVVTSLELTRIY